MIKKEIVNYFESIDIKEDRFQKMINKVLLGDALYLLKEIPNNTIDHINTDPPFGIGYSKEYGYDDSKETVFSQLPLWIKQMYRVLKPNSHIFLFIPTLYIDVWISAIKKKFVFNNLISARVYTTGNYIKNNFSFNSQHIIYASKGKAKQLNKVNWIKTSRSWFKDKRNKNPHEFTYQYPSFLPNHIFANVKLNAQVKMIHVNQKNLDLVKNLILLSTNEEDIVLDPFCGSGTVIKACLKTNRKFICIDNDLKNVEYCKKVILKIVEVS